MKIHSIHRCFCRSAAWLFLAAGSCAWAQQDTADRLWQGVEQKTRTQAAPAPLDDNAQASIYDYFVRSTLTQTPQERNRQLTLAILNAVNQRDWFGADRFLREYAKSPENGQALPAFVDASRLAADGEYAAAIEKYQSVLQSDPQFARGELNLGHVLFADNRLHDAQDVFNRLRARGLPPNVTQHIDEYLGAAEQRQKPRISLSVSAVHEDNVNNASTVVDSCALSLWGMCFANEPGEKQAGTGVYAEATLNKLWSLPGRHGVLLRSINYGNHYWDASNYDSLVSTTYLGYQYASARQQIQVLPLFEFDREGGRKLYHAFGLRASFTQQLGQRAQVEASYEYKARHFADAFADNLEGDFRSLGLFGTYAFKPDLVGYANLLWRDSDARQPIFAYREKIARLGIYKSFGNQVTVNAAYGWRHKRADAANMVFGKLQRDNERSLYLNVSLPGYAWHGLVPTATYEYRDNRSTIPHAYNYEKNRLTLGFNKVF